MLYLYLPPLRFYRYYQILIDTMFVTSNQRPLFYTIKLLDSLLPVVQSPPSRQYSAATQTELFSLCHGLKQFGADVERHREKQMAALCQEFIDICRVSSLPIVLRLQLLEIIELRTLKWTSEAAETLKGYYEKKYSSMSPPKVNLFQRKNEGQQLPNILASPKLKSKEGEAAESIDDTKVMSVVDVRGTKLFLHCSCPKLSAQAMTFLHKHFNPSSSLAPARPRPLKYTSRDLLVLRSSILAVKLSPELSNAAKNLALLLK